MFEWRRRINRATYYTGVALILLVTICVIVLGGTLIGEDIFIDIYESFPGFIIVPIAIILITYWMILIIQRANDIGLHPIIAMLIAVLFLPFVFILGFLPGEKTSNKYGSVPRPGVNLRP